MGNEVKPILIVFEGVDKSGKTTLKNEFNEATNFRYVVLDRLTTSSKVYDRAFGRGRLKYYEDVEKAFADNFNVFEVLCLCDEEKIKQRLNNAKEILPEAISDISRVQENFFEECMSNGYHTLVIDTSLGIEKCVNYIINKIQSS